MKGYYIFQASWGVETYKDLFEVISNLLTSLGFIAIVYAVFAYRISKKQLHFSTMSRCISAYQGRFLTLSKESIPEEIRAYLDFVNEQLFYMRNNYLPRKVSLEWLDGMIDLIPVQNRVGGILNQKSALLRDHQNHLLAPYQRIQKAFQVAGDYSPEKLFSDRPEVYHSRQSERARLVKEIYRNIKSFEYPG